MPGRPKPPCSKSRKRSSWPRIPSRLAASSSLGQQRSLLGLAPRVADQPGAAAGHGDGAVTGELQTSEIAELQEVADMEAVGGGIEPAVPDQPVGAQS